MTITEAVTKYGTSVKIRLRDWREGEWFQPQGFSHSPERWDGVDSDGTAESWGDSNGWWLATPPRDPDLSPDFIPIRGSGRIRGYP